MDNKNFNIVFDETYTPEAINEIVKTTDSESTKAARLMKFSSVFLLATGGVYAYTPEECISISKPDVEFIANDNFEIQSYQNSLTLLNQYELFVCANLVKRELIEKILSFKSLSESWDGYGALPLQIKSASNAIEFLDKFETYSNTFHAPSDIYPNPNGTVSMIWENEYGETVSIEFGNETFTYYTEFSKLAPEFFNKLSVNKSNVDDVSRKILALF